MRKFSALIITAALFCGGCSWLGFGDDSSTTAATATAPEPQAAEVDPAPAPEPKAATTTTKTTKTKAATTKGKKSEAQIKAELDQMGKKLAAQSSRTLLPNKANPAIKQVGGAWVKSYIDVRPEEVTTQLRQGNAGQYVGSIRYAEHYMECRGATRKEAMSAPCTEIRTRNLNELIRYDGKEWQD